MPAAYAGSIAHVSSHGRATDSLLDELSRQLPAVRNHDRQLSRGSNSLRQSNAMRITKPRSAHNSPGSSGLQARRRVVLNDSQYQMQQPRPVEESMCLPMPCFDMDARRSSRPFSWHPPSQYAQQPDLQFYGQPQPTMQPLTSPYALSTYGDADFFARSHQLPETPLIYSGYTSPASAFSPLSLPQTGLDHQPSQYFTQASWAALPELSPSAPRAVSAIDSHGLPMTVPNGYQEKTSAFTTDSWDSFVSHGFNRCSAPPTPEDFVQAQQVEPRLQSEESIPFQPLASEEEEGEILYGMGLYDTPEKPVDPQLAYHRSAISSLLGGTFAPPESTGKGLKLEDAWEPPASEDGDSQEGDDDADGDDQDDD